MLRSGGTAAAGIVPVPCRHLHSPNEMVHLADLENATRLIAVFVRRLTPDSDFRPGAERRGATRRVIGETGAGVRHRGGVRR